MKCLTHDWMLIRVYLIIGHLSHYKIPSWVEQSGLCCSTEGVSRSRILVALTLWVLQPVGQRVVAQL